MANDDDRAAMRRRNLKAPCLQTERTKNEGPSEKKSFKGETVWRFQTKNSKIPLLPWKTKQKKDHKTPRAKTEHEPMQAGGKKVKQNWKNHSE